MLKSEDLSKIEFFGCFLYNMNYFGCLHLPYYRIFISTKQLTKALVVHTILKMVTNILSIVNNKAQQTTGAHYRQITTGECRKHRFYNISLTNGMLNR